jgi:hypothetical protein
MPAQNAARRTHLANERTYLAWWCTAVTAYAADSAMRIDVTSRSSARRGAASSLTPTDVWSRSSPAPGAAPGVALIVALVAA